ncbi:MAG TPA: hypothetical protein VJC13_00650 [Candidatus Paceibacterota bacterium]
MEGHSKLKYFLSFLVAVGVLTLLAFVYQKYQITQEKPYKILTPQSYATGTTVSLYKNTPPDFPKEVLLEDKILDYSGTVTSPQGKTQITVSYVTDKSMQDIVDMYTIHLPALGWAITQKSIYEKVSIIKATKNQQNILMSIAPLKMGEVMVTFQYEQ